MLNGRFFGPDDFSFINSVNDELLKDIIQTTVTLFKIFPNPASINQYGETKQEVGKQYYPGIDMVCHIAKDDSETDYDDFGPNRRQLVVFKFNEIMLKEVNFFPETGDLVLFNERYHEIDNVQQDQFLGGVADKSFSIIVKTHITRLSKINLLNRQS